MNQPKNVKKITATKYDFARMLRQLKLIGWSLEEVAIHANLSETALRNYISGTVPLHPNGERIITLWCEVTSSERIKAPITADCPTPRVSRIGSRTPHGI